ncbi:hypothetical protein V6Z12_D03G180300 [Gossypium hirsutum]|uniref:Protein AGENET DOMAIN (AGD)-CONTAINING P1 n=1 Tax=Gossypium hirsutum TaxID=3635 RepID=A0ABM2ZUW3_GOSHI|nr:protein AGENET DOMAIN (AGD)-CONTAINING P1-like [Gossypium hirsutum]
MGSLHLSLFTSPAKRRTMSQKGKYTIGLGIEDPPHLQPGSRVEIKPRGFGYRGAWFSAIIIKRDTPIYSNHFVVKFTDLYLDKNTGTRPLKKMSIVFIRPQPSPQRPRKFKIGDNADAYHMNGWWEGVIVVELQDDNYVFLFHSEYQWPKCLVFGVSQLRLHRTWFGGYWMPPALESELDVEEVQREEEPTKITMEMEELSEGALVEVANDEDGFNRAWFAAIIVKPVGNNRYMIQYDTVQTEDNTGLGKEMDIVQIRPRPPDIPVPDQFEMLDQVEALYKGGWWKGVIINVLSEDSKYQVYLATHEEMEFKHSNLRLHQDWVHGKWTKPSPVI